MSRAEVSPVSYPVKVAHLPRSGTPVWLEADPRQLDALAAAHGLAEVRNFRFDLVLSPWKRDGVKAVGTVKADIVQECVVTLEPIESRIEEAFEAVFLPEGSKLLSPDVNDASELLIDAEGPDLPEPFAGDSIDAGAVAEEFFGLAIDPYPRKSGVSIDAAGPQEAVDGEPRGPLFDKLRGWAAKP